MDNLCVHSFEMLEVSILSLGNKRAFPVEMMTSTLTLMSWKHQIGNNSL